MALVGTTLVWAANNILVKKLYALGLQPGMVTAARFSLSALVLSPFATWQALRPALSLSLTSFAGNASLALSLRFTTSGRASFFAAMSVAVTPFLEFLLYGSPLRPAFLIASFLCVSGVFLMSRESLMIAHMEHRNAALMGNRVDPHLWGALRGDALALLAAFWFALYTVRLSREAPKHRTEALSSSLRVWTACLATIWASIESCLLGNTDAIIESSKKSLGLPALFYGFAKTLKQMMSALVTRLNGGGIAAYIGLFALALLVIVGAYFQVYGQKRVSSQEAAVLYSLNPIWAGIAGYLFLAETFTLEQVFGGACILLGCVYARRQQQYRQQK
jgi:drug/metabolite transporter (DMT)-like permease